MSKIDTDSELIEAYLSLMRGMSRHQFMVDLGRGAAADILLAATDDSAAEGGMPADDDVDPREVVELFLLGVRPDHEAHGYLDDYWDLIWDAAWPEGLAHNVLGTTENDAYAAASLLTEIERYAADVGMPAAPWFDEADLVRFIKAWRASAIGRLQVLFRRHGSR